MLQQPEETEGHKNSNRLKSSVQAQESEKQEISIGIYM